jgi:hypothetical protein
VGENGSSLHRVKPLASSRRAAWASLVVGLAAFSVVVATLLPPSRDEARGAGSLKRGPVDSRVPDPIAPAFAASDPDPIRPDIWDSVWAPVGKEVDVHARPALGSPIVGRLSALTPEGTDNIVLILDRQVDPDGHLWVRVRFPSLPNDDGKGWISRSALGGYGVVHTRLVIDLSTLSAKLYRRGKLVFDAPVGVGKEKWPTPTGDFYVRNRLAGFGDPFYGPVAFGTSARSSELTDWPAGGFVGIHGTAMPELIPGRVSHGCVRMRNADILKLDRMLPVGAPLRIRR